MTTALYTVHILAGLIVLAEALNKLERSNPFDPGLHGRALVVCWLKMLGWALLAAGSAGAAAAPVLDDCRPSVSAVCVQVGFALLVVRSRLGEKIKGQQAQATTAAQNP
jgi:hypothetical protein